MPPGSSLRGRKEAPSPAPTLPEIERLYYRYSQGLDFAEEETYLSAWADDAVFTQGDGSVLKGKEELRKRWRQAPGGEGKTTLHVTTNILVTPTDDGGGSKKGRGYWMLFKNTRQNPPPAGASATLLRHVHADAPGLADQDAGVNAGMGLAS